MNNKIPGYIVRNGVAVGLDSNITLISSAPIGTVLSFAGSTAPYGYLICNGQEVSRTDYSDLYKVIGTTYGEGDRETTFNIPNLVDKFIQGSTISGTEKEAGLPNITGSITKTTTGTGDNFLADNTASGLSINGALSIKQYKTVKSMANGEESYSSPASIDFDASKSDSIYGNSDTVQPPALTMIYIIKALHINEGMDKNENPIRTTLDITLAENDCDNIPNLISDMTTVVSTVSSDIVAHTPKDTFATETGFFEITTTRQNSTYAWQTAKRLGGKPNVFQRCMLDGVWEQWCSVGVVRDDLTNDINTWSSNKIKSIMPTTRSLPLASGYNGYITEVYDPTTKVVVYNVNIEGTFKGLGNMITTGFKVPKGAVNGDDVMHTTLGVYASSSGETMTGTAQFTRMIVRNYSNPFLDVDINGAYRISGTITYITA